MLCGVLRDAAPGPQVFSGLWAAAKAFIDPVTAAKITFISGDTSPGRCAATPPRHRDCGHARASNPSCGHAIPSHHTTVLMPSPPCAAPGGDGVITLHDRDHAIMI